MPKHCLSVGACVIEPKPGPDKALRFPGPKFFVAFYGDKFLIFPVGKPRNQGDPNAKFTLYTEISTGNVFAILLGSQGVKRVCPTRAGPKNKTKPTELKTRPDRIFFWFFDQTYSNIVCLVL